MVVANAGFCEYQGSMTEQQILERILELEQQLLTANETVAKLILSTTELTRQLSEAETRNKKLKRSSRRDESSFRQQLSVAQSRRF
jgi:phage shock protein A